jgi:hypothetical protein
LKEEFFDLFLFSFPRKLLFFQQEVKNEMQNGTCQNYAGRKCEKDMPEHPRIFSKLKDIPVKKRYTSGKH